MAKGLHANPQTPPTRRDKAAEARRKARLKKDARENRIIDNLNRGMSVTELAARQGVTLRRMQILVREILARRAPSPPAEYLALQVNRLNEAMIVAYGSMAGGNLKAVDRVLPAHMRHRALQIVAIETMLRRIGAGELRKRARRGAIREPEVVRETFRP